MNLATIRIEGSDNALAAIKKSFPLACDSEWNKGEIRRNGKTHEASGMYATVVDAGNPKELTDLVRKFLVKCVEKEIKFHELGLAAELSIGFTVGDSIQFVAGVGLSATDLSMFSDCGIDLSITAYPTSDEANDENAT